MLNSEKLKNIFLNPESTLDELEQELLNIKQLSNSNAKANKESALMAAIKQLNSIETKYRYSFVLKTLQYDQSYTHTTATGDTAFHYFARHLKSPKIPKKQNNNDIIKKRIQIQANEFNKILKFIHNLTTQQENVVLSANKGGRKPGETYGDEVDPYVNSALNGYLILFDPNEYETVGKQIKTKSELDKIVQQNHQNNGFVAEEPKTRIKAQI